MPDEHLFSRPTTIAAAFQRLKTGMSPELRANDGAIAVLEMGFYSGAASAMSIMCSDPLADPEKLMTDLRAEVLSRAAKGFELE